MDAGGIMAVGIAMDGAQTSWTSAGIIKAIKAGLIQTDGLKIAQLILSALTTHGVVANLSVLVQLQKVHALEPQDVDGTAAGVILLA